MLHLHPGRLPAGGLPARPAVLDAPDPAALRLHLPDLVDAAGAAGRSPTSCRPATSWSRCAGSSSRERAPRCGGRRPLALRRLRRRGAGAGHRADGAEPVMRSLLNILVKELLQLRRDPKILPILFIAPVVQLLDPRLRGDHRRASGSSWRCATSTAPPPAATLVEALHRSVLLPARSRPSTPSARSTRCSTAGAARLALTIPAGFAAERAAGRPGRVQLLADGSDATAGTVGLGYAAKRARSSVDAGPASRPAGRAAARSSSTTPTS